MTKLHLPKSEYKRKQAYGSIIAQIMDKTRLSFPKKIREKEAFLQVVIEGCNEVDFNGKLPCKWGLISKPIEFLENLIDDEWAIEE